MLVYVVTALNNLSAYMMSRRVLQICLYIIVNMTITSTITFKGYGILCFSDPVLGMQVFSDLLAKTQVPYLEFRYSKDYPMQGIFNFKDLFSQNGWQYMNVCNNEVFINYRKDIPRKFIKEIGIHLQSNLTSYEKSYYRVD